ncbi:YhcH/YjgK/YiaL family protein [Vibrio fluvialis]|uniref:YhcH/YjgK/YiaL family protein n=1 Tax=Vibrio fluvialis TaxID=676 RepID=UPI001404A774|nr:YhcH/YjgK/YiaL family protein [Vibrio fluvialis]EKO3540642.1 YhcH/YjgK/YiaL family protein [Vibrio fluvialis]EKO3979209.1 YhcH/YjgK/YiaL family protein [Vibrio fluvialis]ELP2651053.1 YhcH/YjgK/YiaL family protein [Vibrio fluvialis]MBY8244900.1 YhcH/YjgK/YiaL family protein [Vibrio fluvialis]
MFIGKTSQLEFAQCLSPKLLPLIRQALAQLNEAEMHGSPMATGRHDLDGDNAFFFIMNDHTQLLAERKSECHRRYLDVQILLEGRETFGYSLTPFNGLDEDMLDERDLAFSEQLNDELFVSIQAGEFIVFYPGQPHRPLIATEDEPMPVRKMVIKVDKALFA